MVPLMAPSGGAERVNLVGSAREDVATPMKAVQSSGRWPMRLHFQLRRP
jgi:hypothetical protein